MEKNLKQKKYDKKMKALGLKKICVWADESDHDKIKKTARLSRNRTIRGVNDE